MEAQTVVTDDRTCWPHCCCHHHCYQLCLPGLPRTLVQADLGLMLHLLVGLLTSMTLSALPYTLLASWGYCWQTAKASARNETYVVQQLCSHVGSSCLGQVADCL